MAPCFPFVECVLPSYEVVREVLKKMQELPIVKITQKEGGTQLKLVIEFEVNKGRTPRYIYNIAR